MMEAFIEFITLVKQNTIIVIHRHNTDIITMTGRSLGICIYLSKHTFDPNYDQHHKSDLTSDLFGGGTGRTTVLGLSSCPDTHRTEETSSV